MNKNYQTELALLTLKHLPYIIWIVTQDNTLIYIGPSVRNILGFTVDEAMNAGLKNLFSPHAYALLERTNSTIIQQDWDKQDSDRISTSVELEMINKENHTVFVEYTGKAVFKEEGNELVIVGIAKELSATKQVDTDIEQAYIFEKYLRESFETEIEKRIEFAHFLIHELKTPLVAILAAIEVLHDVRLSSPYDRALGVTLRASKELNKRIGEIVELTKSEIGKLEIKPRRTNPAKIIRETIKNLEAVVLLENKHIRIVLPTDLPFIRADKGRISQVLMNLIFNAVKFTPQYGEVIVSAFEKGKYVIFQVQDFGSGILKEDQEQLFQPYFTGTNRKNQGFGLGLALSRNIVESHGGEIWVNSVVDKGSIFCFSIPFSRH